MVKIQKIGQSAAKPQTSKVVGCSSTTRRRWVKIYLA